MPAGARKGGFGLDSSPGTVLFSRLAEHAESISQVESLVLEDFFCRFLAVDDQAVAFTDAELAGEFGGDQVQMTE